MMTRKPNRTMDTWALAEHRPMPKDLLQTKNNQFIFVSMGLGVEGCAFKIYVTINSVYCFFGGPCILSTCSRYVQQAHVCVRAPARRFFLQLLVFSSLGQLNPAAWVQCEGLLYHKLRTFLLRTDRCCHVDLVDKDVAPVDQANPM